MTGKIAVVSLIAVLAIPMMSGQATAARHKTSTKSCYPVYGECTKDSDCCTGFCRPGSGRYPAYCDYK